jgi:hypothetical protein
MNPVEEDGLGLEKGALVPQEAEGRVRREDELKGAPVGEGHVECSLETEGRGPLDFFDGGGGEGLPEDGLDGGRGRRAAHGRVDGRSGRGGCDVLVFLVGRPVTSITAGGGVGTETADGGAKVSSSYGNGTAITT